MTATVTPISNLHDLAGRLKILADPNRLRILDLLMQGVRCNCELGDTLDIAPNLISHHLGVLRRAGLINAQRDSVDARWIYYSVNETAVGELRAALDQVLDHERIQFREPQCTDSINV